MIEPMREKAESTGTRERLLSRVCLAYGVSALIIGAVSAVSAELSTTTVGAAMIVGVCVVVWLLRNRASLDLRAQVVVYGATVAIAQAIVLDRDVPLERGLIGLGLTVVVAALLIGSRHARLLGGVNILLVALLFAVDIVQSDLTVELAVRGAVALCFFPVVVAVVVPAVDQFSSDFSRLRRQVRHAEGLAEELGGATKQLEAAALQISVMSQEQRQGAIRQSSAIKEVLEAMHSMTTSSHQIAAAARGVVTNADLAFTNSEQVGDRVAVLTSHIQRITETLQSVSTIARKSEILALNASLEGTRAGEAGRGFSLVASQMQGLAENVMSAVAEIKRLTVDVRQATKATEHSMVEATDLARATADAARQIHMVSQYQQTATDQVTKAMDDIDAITAQVADGNEQTWSATEDLGDLAYRLNELVAKLVLH